MCWDLFRVPFVDARIFMVYGPGQRDFKKLIPYTILSLMQGRAPRISSGARQVDWIYVDDVVNGLLALALAPGVEGQSIELGTGRVTAVKVVVDQLTRLINPDLPAVLGGVRDRVHEHVRCADLVRSTQLTGWRPSVALEDGLRRTIDYYLQTSSV
jgi:nucleoside-diphosphate-sugar epimerase